MGFYSGASDPPVELNLWTPHANPLMQRILVDNCLQKMEV